MKLTLSVAIALNAALGLGSAAAQGREVILNYSDPQGADLTSAIVPHLEELPDWIRKIGTAVAPEKRDMAIGIQPGGAGAAPQYTLAVPNVRPDVRTVIGAAPTFKLEPANGRPIEMRGSAGKLNASMACGAAGRASSECKFSDPTTAIVVLLAKSASTNQTGLRALARQNNLVFDSRSARRVVASLDADGSIDHVDFIGILRGKQEYLEPPDATSVSVLRFYKDGRYEIVRRAQDAPINLRDVKFGFEERK